MLYIPHVLSSYVLFPALLLLAYVGVQSVGLTLDIVFNGETLLE